MPIADLALTFEKLLQGAPLGLALLDPPCQLVWANPSFFGAAALPATLVGQDLSELPFFKGRPPETALARAFRERSSSFIRDLPLPGSHSGGRPATHVDVWVWPLPGAEQERVHALVMVSGSEARHQEHQKAQLFYESFLTSSNAIEVTDRNGILVDVNPAFERIYGYSRAECVGRRPNLVRSRQTSSEVYEKMWKDLLNPHLGHWSGEIMNRDRRGRERPVFLTITAIRNEEGEVTHYLGVAVDLTEQRKWERGAARADRLAAIGQLAAGVAHEINTPLANIMLVAESIKRKSEDPWLASRVNSITGQVDVAARIVRGLLDYSRQTEPHMVEVDLVQLVKDSVEFLQGKQSADVELEQHLPTSSIPVLADRGQLIQVLTNVLNNAYDAIGGSGRVILRVRRDGPEAEIEIADSGPGIPEEVLPRIFEPFFTTKEEGKGTGLGLAICHSILVAHHGSIVARNLLGGGASFLIRMPLASSPPAGHTPAKAKDPAPRAG